MEPKQSSAEHRGIETRVLKINKINKTSRKQRQGQNGLKSRVLWGASEGEPPSTSNKATKSCRDDDDDDEKSLRNKSPANVKERKGREGEDDFPPTPSPAPFAIPQRTLTHFSQALRRSHALFLGLIGSPVNRFITDSETDLVVLLLLLL